VRKGAVDSAYGRVIEVPFCFAFSLALLDSRDITTIGRG
jgi:hypothetical protein